MSAPGLLARGDHARVRVVQEVGVFPQAPPHAELLARIVGLVDEVALLGVGAVSVAQRNGGSLPRAGLEVVAVLVTQLHRLAKRSEEGVFVGEVPAEARRATVGIATGRRSCRRCRRRRRRCCHLYIVVGHYRCEYATRNA